MANEKRLIEYINREKVCKLCDNKKEYCGKEKCPVYKAPTVDAVEVVHGRWVGSGKWNHKPYRMRDKEKWQTYLCSECGHSNGRRFNDNYCPNCGAKMDGGNEDGQDER